MVIFCVLIVSGCNDNGPNVSQKKSLGIDTIGDLRKILPDSSRSGAVALVIGQRNYRHISKLTFADIDADSMANVLESFGIHVIKKINVTKTELIDALDVWRQQLPNYQVGLLYYSGHGIEVMGKNYLLPVDLPNKINMDIEREAVSLDTITSIMENGKMRMNLIVLDACRNNPFGTKSLRRGGFAYQDVPVGTFIGFSALPGHVSYDIGTTNSIYTEGILKFIRYPDITIDQVFTNVNGYVRQATGSNQVPSKNSSLDANFYFNLSKNSTSTKNLNLDYKSQYSNNIMGLFPGIAFGSPVEDILALEFGEPYRNSFSFKDLPISSECTNNEIRYYWRTLAETRTFFKLYNYLESQGLADYIDAQGSSVFYTFKDAKLFRLAVNLKFTDIRFHRKLMEALQIRDEKYWSKFFDYNPQYFTVVELSDIYNQTSLMYGQGEGFSYCNFDWFSRSDTINAFR